MVSLNVHNFQAVMYTCTWISLKECLLVTWIMKVTERSIAVASWNNFPENIKPSPSPDTFKPWLKTFLSNTFLTLKLILIYVPYPFLQPQLFRSSKNGLTGLLSYEMNLPFNGRLRLANGTIWHLGCRLQWILRQWLGRKTTSGNSFKPNETKHVVHTMYTSDINLSSH